MARMHPSSLVCVMLLTFISTSHALQSMTPPHANEHQPTPSSALIQTSKNVRLEKDKKEIMQFLNTKNLIKTAVKLFFGNHDESEATSRQMLNFVVKIIEVLKSSFGQKGRSSSKATRLRDSADDAAQASLSMVKGYIKSILSKDYYCVQRNICESAMNASRESRELGGLIAQLGGYATSYLLESQRSMPFPHLFEAARLGRTGADCQKVYRTCSE